VSARRDQRQLTLDPLELSALADKSAFDRARVYEAANLGHLERIEVEARLAASLSHPNLVKATSPARVTAPTW
jgi:hypothetical protein